MTESERGKWSNLPLYKLLVRVIVCFIVHRGSSKKNLWFFLFFVFLKWVKGWQKSQRTKKLYVFLWITSFYFYWRSLSIWNLTRHRPSISFIVYHYKHLSLSTEFSMKISLRNLINIYKEIQILLYNLATIGQVCPLPLSPPPKKQNKQTIIYMYSI